MVFFCFLRCIVRLEEDPWSMVKLLRGEKQTSTPPPLPPLDGHVVAVSVFVTLRELLRHSLPSCSSFGVSSAEHFGASQGREGVGGGFDEPHLSSTYVVIIFSSSSENGD